MDELIIITFAALLVFLLRWGFKNLPEEKWQILWSIPFKKREDGTWSGVNFTYYGLFNAAAVMLATSVMTVLMGAVDVPAIGIFCVAAGVFSASLPSAKLVARAVEKKKSTFSIGAASFVGLITAPVVAVLCKKLFGFDAPAISIIAALSISYSFGEGVGRLACISFGCCYGKPLADCSLFLNKIFENRHFVFTGKTKKIAYAHQMDRRAVLPIQAVTSVLYSAAGLLGLFFFANGFFRTALILTLTVTQFWRFASEFYRSDYRGEGKISAYQKLSLSALIYGLAIAMLFPVPAAYHAALINGLKILWNPWAFLLLQLLGAMVFLYMGKSSVTESVLSFHVNREKI